MSFGGNIRAGKSEEPSGPKKVGYAKAAKKKRPALVGGLIGIGTTLTVGVGTALVNWGEATVTGALLGAASGAAGMYATHAASSAVEGRQSVDGASGNATSVKDVVTAATGVADKIREEAGGLAIQVKSQIEAILGRINSAIPESNQDAPVKIELTLQAAVSEADDVKAHCDTAIDRVETWRNGL